MDLSDISKVANRKRINIDVEKLREKVSRETAKIIKLKVAQDTAYWDLKEKLQQVEGNHERLQQNMVEVQMQHETISGQYQEELRLRPETLNKLSSTRDICDVLEDYSERLKQTLSRCKLDQETLCDAYHKSGQLVRDIKTRQQRSEEKSRQAIEALEDKVKLSSEHQAQLSQILTVAKQQADSELAAARERLAAAHTHRDQLLATANDLTRQLDHCKNDIQKKDESLANLQRDMKQLVQEFNNQGAEAKNAFAQLDKELSEAKETNGSLKEALANQEQFTKSICEQNDKLMEKVAALEEESLTLTQTVDSLKIKLQEAVSMNESFQRDIEILNTEKEQLTNELNARDEMIKNYQIELINLKHQLEDLEKEKSELMLQANKLVENSNIKSSQLEELNNAKQALEAKIADTENALQSFKQSSEEHIRSLTSSIESKEKELDSKANTITQLMSELKIGTDHRSKLEMTLQKIKKEMETEREATREKEKKMAANIEKLEASVREKDDELSKQMSIILEMRNEKERLQDKIEGMQGTIDNIQKELTRPPTRPQPDMDDNAVMLTPARMQKTVSSPIKAVAAEFAVPRAEPKLDNMLYNLLSDSSMDGDTVDTSEVTRRFAALSRGERVSPLPLHAIRRHPARPRPRPPAVPAAQGGLRLKDQTEISLSQVKNDLQNKERSFFKNKRVENKVKRLK